MAPRFSASATRIFRSLALIGLILSASWFSADAQRQLRPERSQASASTMVLAVYATGLDKPVDIANSGVSGDERLFVVEKDGAIKIIEPGGILRSPAFLDIDGRVKSIEFERGLLGLAFDPQYEQNGFFYVNYTIAEATGTEEIGDTRVSRFKTMAGDPNKADADSEVVVLRLPQPEATHNGGDLIFGPDGYLYIMTGDGGGEGDPDNHAQNGNSLLGKILRIDVSTVTPSSGYAIPADNPFVGVAGVRDEIWASGLRNPWRASFDRVTGDLYFGDVGQEIWEEINYQAASSTGGENYGWRCYEALSMYNPDGCAPASQYDFPIHNYSHLVGRTVIGGYVYRGAQFPAVYGHYFFANFGAFFESARLWSLQWEGGQLHHHEWGTYPGLGISSFGEDIHGELFLADLLSGHILKFYGENLFLPILTRAE